MPCSIVREERGEVASGLVWDVEQKAGEVVCKSGFGGAGFSGGAARTGIAKGAVTRGLTISEGIDTAWAERLLLQQSIANAAQVAAKLKRVIAKNLGPRVRKVDIRLRADPGQASREANQRRIAVKQAINRNAHDSAGYSLIEVNARNAERLRCIRPEIGVMRLIVVPRYSSTKLRDEGIREKAIVVETDAIRILKTAPLKVSLCWSAGYTKYRRLQNGWTLKAESPAQAIFIGKVGIHFGIDEIRIFVEGQQRKVVVCLERISWGWQ